MAKPSWSTVSPTSGTGNTTVTVTVTEHTGLEPRSGVITVTPNIGAAKTCTITQTGATQALNWTQASWNANASGGNLVLTGTSNCSMLGFALKAGSGISISIPTSYLANGASATNGEAIPNNPGASARYNFSITLSIPSNTTISSRSAVIVVTGKPVTQVDEATINQAAGSSTLTIAPESASYVAAGESKNVAVTTNSTWSANKGSYAWLTTSPASGTENGNCSVEAGAYKGRNNRTGTVVFSVTAGGSISKNYTVTQNGAEAYIQFDQATWFAGKAGGNITITGRSNTPSIGFTSTDLGMAPIPSTYTVNGSTSAGTSGTAIPGDPGGTGEFTFSITFAVPANTTISSRSSTIGALCTSPQATASCTLTQAAGDGTLELNPTSLTFVAAGGSSNSKTFQVITNQGFDLS